MYLSELFRSFRPLHNPIGFGVADFLLLGITLAMAAAILLRAALAPYIVRIAGRTAIAMTVLAALPILLRLALLRTSPVPIAAGADDFSYLLLGDTLRHFRLANAMHPLHEFFEAVFVLQQPTYSSIYPVGQGLALALGRIVFGSSWAGVLLSVAALCVLCYWMLRGWTSPRWAFLGGLLAVIEFGPLNQWTNSYWGGALSACAGCLAFGALPRLEQSIENSDRGLRTRYAILLGSGIALQFITRPYECLLMIVCVLLYCLLRLHGRPAWPHWARVAALASLAVCPAIALTLMQNKSVTGSWTTLPYALSRYQYGVPTTFTWQSNPVPHTNLTPEQELDYRAQAAIHGAQPESLKSYLARLVFRLRYLRFFWLAPLYFAAALYLRSFKQRKWQWPLLATAVFLAGTNFYPYFYPHYIAALSCVLLLIVVKGLESAPRARIAGTLLTLCGAHFLFWYGLHLSGSEHPLEAAAYETWDYVNPDDPAGRRTVRQTLSDAEGSQLVFVRYSAAHRFEEWIGNEADIDGSKVVWARDLGPDENQKLIRYFPHRKLWLLEPDIRPPRLSVYSKPDDPFESLH